MSKTERRILEQKAHPGMRIGRSRRFETGPMRWAVYARRVARVLGYKPDVEIMGDKTWVSFGW